MCPKNNADLCGRNPNNISPLQPTKTDNLKRSTPSGKEKVRSET